MMDRSASILWTSAEAAAVTGGTNTRDWHATGVAISMEDLQPGDLYFATRDDDLEEVFKKGAAAVALAGGTGSDKDWPVLKVSDAYEALQSLAGAGRYRTHSTIIAVQGRAARQDVYALLRCAAPVHEGGRHLSLGLAALPDNVEYGLFSASPAVRPDIAVITNCAASHRDTLFETMPSSGTVIINADDEDHLHIVARARAAGVRRIMTYGRHAYADARLCDCVRADNGSRVTANILGEEISFLLSKEFSGHEALIPALLILKLTDKSLSAALRAFEQAHGLFSSFEGAVTLIDPALRRQQVGPQAVFKITNMIDWGLGRQTAMLDNFTSPLSGSVSLCKKDLAIPRKLASLDFVYTSRDLKAVPDAHTAIRERHRNVKLEPIVPAVLAPGDFLVFKQVWNSSKAAFSEALRLVPAKKTENVEGS
jgi:UDP-N-acetylmuramoyl-tripeptide--D-alanyl-D-alanine ligase